MKRIMIAALAVLMMLTISVGGILPAFAAEHDHSADAGASIGANANVGASDADEVGADLSDYKPTTFFPITAEPINNIADFLAMQQHGVYYLNTDLELVYNHPGLKQAILYGNGHTITTTMPIFESIDDVEIYDLTIEGNVVGEGNIGALAKEAYVPRLYGVVNNANVTSTTNGYTGGLIGFVLNRAGKIVFESCVNNGNIDNASAASGKTDAGGLAGIVRGVAPGTTSGDTYTQKVTANDMLVVNNCLNTGTVYGSNRTGGLIGVMGENIYMLGTVRVTNSANTGKVTSTQHYVGGLAARLSGIDCVVENCLNTGEIVTLTASKYGGGLIGLCEDPGCSYTFRNCRNEGFVNMTQNAGGIVGLGNSSGNDPTTGLATATNNRPKFYFYDCVNVGTVTGGNNASGICFVANATDTVFERCENSGAISGKDNAGGIALQINSTKALIKDCYNSGAINGSDAGGMVGEISGNGMQITIQNCVNDGAITGGRPGGIMGVLEAKTSKLQVLDCTNNAKVTSTSNYGGGIAGRADAMLEKATVAGFESQAPVAFIRCLNTGEVEVFQSQGGGIVGYVDGTHNLDGSKDSKGNDTIQANEVFHVEFKDCINTAYIHPTDVTKNVGVGGIGGSVDAHTTATNCVNTGEIKSGGGAGGIFGFVHRYGAVVSCVNVADVTGGTQVGGIAGRVGGDHQPSTGSVVEKCLNTGKVTGGTKATDKSHSTAGILGYGYGVVSVRYCAALGDVIANYPATFASKPGNMLTVGAIAGYQNHGSGDYQNNYHSGTITCTNTDDAIIVALKQTPGDNIDRGVGSKFVNNFTKTALPLYYHRVAAGPDNNSIDDDTFAISTATSTAITQAIGSNDFLNTLNTAAGTDAFVMVTSCEGESFPIHVDTVATFSLALGEHDDPSYNYYTERNSDGENHWYQCPVCEKVDPETVEAHTGGTATCVAKAVCTVCSASYGELDAHNHANTFTWVKTALTHSAEFSCCSTAVVEEAHDFENGVCTVCSYTCLHDVAHEDNTAANCSSAAYCAICASYYGTADADAHVFETEWSFEGDKHFHACTNDGCTAREGEAACSGGDAKCNALAVCEVCEHEYGALDPEDHGSTAFAYTPNAEDATKHDKKHDCCGVFVETLDHGAENHVSDATCMKGAVCALCGEYGAKNPMNHVEAPNSYKVDPDDAAKHLAVYGACCGAEVPEAHVGGTATCDKPANCSLCNALYGEASGDHTYSGDCDVDCDACGAGRSPAAHAFGEWTVTVQPTETEPGTQERTCQVCGEKQTASVSVITNSDDALSGIQHWGGVESIDWIGWVTVIGAVLLVGGVVAAFVISKKRKAK